MRKEKQSVALLISTYNWPEALELVLLSVTKQTKMPDEVVIADDGSKEDTKHLINKFHNQYNLQIKHIWHEDKGFRKSLIINKAVKQIESAYIIEIDGDIIIHSKFIEDHLKAAQPGFFVQGSRVMITERKAHKVLRDRNIDFSFFDKGIANRLNAIHSTFFSKLFNLIPLNPFHLKGCNLAFWKDDFTKINGYNNDFIGWGAEDYEFGARLLHSGTRRKNLKLAGIAYHIFHPNYDMSNRLSNDHIYRDTLSNKSTTCKNGYLNLNS